MLWKEREFPACRKSHGLPLYCAAWVKEEVGGEWTVVLGGGGEEGQRGIKNALVLSKFNPSSMSFSDAFKLEWGERPHRIVVDPAGNVAFASFRSGCSWFKIEDGSNLRYAGPLPIVTEDAGLQSALAFNSEKSLLATGGQDGRLRLFKWSNGVFQLVFDQMYAHGSVNDLAFSNDGTLLASSGSGYCRIWETDNNMLVHNIPQDKDEVFEFCRFSDKVLYLTSRKGQQRMIVSWDCVSPKKVVTKLMVVSDLISAFDISADGKLLALGTIKGHTVILNSSNMSLLTVAKKSHTGLVTALAFNGSRDLLSISADATTKVTSLRENRRERRSTFLIFMVLFLSFVLNHFCPLELSDLFSSLRFSKSSFNFGLGQIASAAPYNESLPT